MINLGLIQELLPSVLTNAEQRFQNLKSSVDYDKLSTKLKSELISNMLEASFEEVSDEIEAPLSDDQADLIVRNENLEIKTAKTTRIWRGGEFSKRESDYVLVSYDDSGDDLKWFFLYTYLTEDDWKSSGSKNYYATTIDLDYVLENKEYKILVGDYQKKRILNHLICQ